MRCLKVFLRTVEVVFIVFCFYAVTLFFRDQALPADWVEEALAHCLPTNLVVRMSGVSIGFLRGVTVRGLEVYDLASVRSTELLAGADEISFSPVSRRLVADGLRYTRLPDSYYAPGNHERNARIEATFPDLGRYSIELIRPDILGVKARSVMGWVEVRPRRLEANGLRLVWPTRAEPMTVDGSCLVDLERQELTGSVGGLAKQVNLRDMMLVLDIPSAMPYYDGFTEVPGPVPARCSWKVNLINNDFDMTLNLQPAMGRYNGVRMKSAEGDIKLHVYTRGDWLNYHQTIGPILGRGLKGEALEGTVVVDGTNGYNTVTVEARSALPVASLLKIGGFVGDYVGADVVGNSQCSLQFRFPRSMTNNYEVLNGKGHIEIRDGQVMRMRGFKGLIEAMPSIAPAVSWFSDSTRASCDYVIENGVVRSDNIHIEGKCFSIRMSGAFDATTDRLDYTVLVQFMNDDSLIGKFVQNLTKPFVKMLLEFKLTGSPSNPHWRYNSVLHQVMEVVK